MTFADGIFRAKMISRQSKPRNREKSKKALSMMEIKRSLSVLKAESEVLRVNFTLSSAVTQSAFSYRQITAAF